MTYDKSPSVRNAGSGLGRLSRILVLLSCPSVLVGIASIPSPAAATGPVDRFVFTPVADTFVNDADPGSSFGKLGNWWVDSSPTRQSFLRFDLSNIGGRTVVDVRLRLYQLDSSNTGGRVFSISENNWDESMTWNNRPAIDGPQLGSFGVVAKKLWYEADLGAMTLVDGPVSFALDSPDTNGADWSSRESFQPPKLIVEVDPVPGLVLDGLSQVANPYLGSSDPTYYPGNHRLTMTSGGRILAVHGRHKTGVQLVWRDPAGGWQTTTTGDVPEGLLEPDPGSTGDWPASIAVAPDSTGEQHAWVVWSGYTTAVERPVHMRRLSDLVSPNGPTVGPLVTIREAGEGNARVDLAFEDAPDGSKRGAVSYYRQTGTSAYEEVVVWFTDLDTDTPLLHDETILFTATINNYAGTLVNTAVGLRLMSRTDSGKLVAYMHSSVNPLTTWTRSGAGVTASYVARPSAVALDSDEILVTVVNTTNTAVKVIKFSSSGATALVQLTVNGYRDSSIASDGTNAWLVMIRASDGFVVSRNYTPSLGWSATDQVEIGAEGGGNYQWPNLLRETDGRLRLIVRGPAFPGARTQNAVLAYQRLL